jgi:hypothetical protein
MMYEGPGDPGGATGINFAKHRAVGFQDEPIAGQQGDTGMATNKVDLSIRQQALAQFQRTQQSQDKAKVQDNETAAPHETATQNVDVRGERFERSEVAQQFERLNADLDAGKAAAAREPDLRQERIDEVRERLLNGDYDTPEVRKQVAESLERVMKILDLFVS